MSYYRLHSQIWSSNAASRPNLPYSFTCQFICPHPTTNLLSQVLAAAASSLESLLLILSSPEFIQFWCQGCFPTVFSDTVILETSLVSVFKVMHLLVWEHHKLDGSPHLCSVGFHKPYCFHCWFERRGTSSWKKVVNYVLRNAFQSSWPNFVSVNMSKKLMYSPWLLTYCWFLKQTGVSLVMLLFRTKLLVPVQGGAVTQPAGLA